MIDVLDARARALARPHALRSEDLEGTEFAVFVIAGERYAIDVQRIVAIDPLVHFAPLPGAPPYVLGLTVFRGEPLLVIDLGRFLEIPRPGVTDLSRLIVLGDLGISAVGTLGIAADVAVAVERTLPDATTILDASALLADARLFIDEL